MNIARSRDQLVRELEARDHTLLLLSGTARSQSKSIHDLAVLQATEPWRATVWIKSLDLLEGRELDWLPEKDRYAVLSVTREGPVLVRSGPTSELMRGERPSVLRLRRVFAQGDAHEDDAHGEASCL